MITLHYKKIGTGYPLIILHGLYGSGDNWLTIGKKLSEHFEVYLIDLRNHGNSPHPDKHNYVVMTDDIYQFLNEHNIKKTNIIGHSMGGKAAMFFTAKYPVRVNKLIVVDVSPNSNNSSKISIEHHYILDCLIKINLESVKNFKDIDEQLKIFFKEEKLRSFLLKNVTKKIDGSFSWKINIPVLKKELNSIFEGIPADTFILNKTLFIKGAQSEYLSETDYEKINTIFIDSQIKVIPNAGHWVHAEQPEMFFNCVMEFLT